MYKAIDSQATQIHTRVLIYIGRAKITEY